MSQSILVPIPTLEARDLISNSFVSIRSSCEWVHIVCTVFSSASLSIVFLTFTHVFVCQQFIASCKYICLDLSISFPTEKQFSCCQSLFCYIKKKSWYEHSSMSFFFEGGAMSFHFSWIGVKLLGHCVCVQLYKKLYIPMHNVWVSVAPYPHQHLGFVSLILAILMGMCLIVVLICMSPTNNDFGHLSQNFLCEVCSNLMLT